MNEKEASDLVSELYDSLYGPLLRYVAQASGRLDFSEEVVQEVFTRLYQQLRKGRRIENPRAWAYCVARREIGNRLKESSLLGTQAPLEQVDELAQAGAAFSEPGDDVQRLLAVLTARETEVVLLRLGNLKYREIGGELGISTKAVGTLLARALEKLRRAMAQSGPGGPVRAYVENQRPKPLQ